MKSIFKKLSVVVLCGAFAVVGCTDFSADLKDFNDRLTANEQATATNAEEIAKLKNAIAALQTEIDKTYATISEVNALQDALQDLQTALNGKATPEDIQAAVEQVTEVINGLDDKYPTKEYVDGLKEELQGMINNIPEYDDTELQGKVTDLEGRVSELESFKTQTVTDLGDVKDRLTKLENKLIEIKDVQGLADQLLNITNLLGTKADLAALAAKADKTELDNLRTDLEKVISDAVADLATNQKLTEELAKLDEKIKGEYEAAIKAAIKVVEDAYKLADSKLQESIDKLTKDLKDLTDRVTALENKEDQDTIYDDTLVLGMISEVSTSFDALANDLRTKVEKIAGDVEKLQTALRSIVSVPQLIVNGLNSVEFKTLTYVPVGETMPVTKAYDAEVYYVFNPSDFDLDAATYSIISEEVEIRTKSASEESVSIVDKERVNREGKVKFVLRRGNGLANMFALAADLSDDENVKTLIYSDYVQIVDTELTVEDFALVDNTGAALTDLDVTVNLASPSDLASYVDVDGYDPAAYGLGYNFVVEEGNLVLDGSAVVAEESGRGAAKVRVELVDLENDKVLSYGYLNVTVVGPVTYYTATVEASVESSRLTFELTEEVLREWAQDIKDQPNTTELVADAVTAILDGNYLTAFNYLGGVPGFKTITTTFTGKGEAKVKVLDSFDATEDSLVPDVEAITSVSDLVAVINKIGLKYDETVYSQIFSEINIVDYIPATTISYYLEKVPILGSSLVAEFEKALEDFKALDGTSLLNLLQNDMVAMGLDLVFSYVSNIEEDYDPYTKMKNKLLDIVKNLEGAGSLATNPEEYAAYSAVADAKKMARDAVNAAFNAANDAIKENLENGPWGIAKKVLESDLADKVCEEFEITEEQNTILLALDTILYKAQYDSLDLLNIEYTPDPVVATPSTVIE